LAGARSSHTRRLVSIVSETFGSQQQQQHAALYRCFSWQTYEERELVVIDRAPSPSTFLTSAAERDDRVRYTHVAAAEDGAATRSTEPMVLGAFVARFDASTLYAPDYVGRMVAALAGAGADLVVLSAFHFYDGRDPTAVSYYDADADTAAGRHLRRWGQGFAVAYAANLPARARSRGGAPASTAYAPATTAASYDLCTTAARLGLRCASYRDAANGATVLRLGGAAGAPCWSLDLFATEAPRSASDIPEIFSHDMLAALEDGV